MGVPCDDIVVGVDGGGGGLQNPLPCVCIVGPGNWEIQGWKTVPKFNRSCVSWWSGLVVSGQ